MKLEALPESLPESNSTPRDFCASTMPMVSIWSAGTKRIASRRTSVISSTGTPSRFSGDAIRWMPLVRCCGVVVKVNVMDKKMASTRAAVKSALTDYPLCGEGRFPPEDCDGGALPVERQVD